MSGISGAEPLYHHTTTTTDRARRMVFGCTEDNYDLAVAIDDGAEAIVRRSFLLCGGRTYRIVRSREVGVVFIRLVAGFQSFPPSYFPKLVERCGLS